MNNLIGKRAKLIDISGVSCGYSLANQLLNATGIITKIDDFGTPLYYLTLDEPWKSLCQIKEGRDYCISFDYRFEIIEDGEVAESKEFDNLTLMYTSRDFVLLSMEFQNLFADRMMS